MRDLGPYPDWKEAFDKAQQLLADGEIHAITIISVPELTKKVDEFISTPLVPELRGKDKVKSLNFIAEMESSLHGEYDHLRLWIQPIENPNTFNTLIICVIRKGEGIEKIDFS